MASLASRMGLASILICAFGCSPASGTTGTDGDTDSGTEGDTEEPSTGSETTSEPTGPLMLDVLFVIDNSTGTGAEQQRLASTATGFVEQMRSLSSDVNVNVMITTTDMSNALCSGMEPDGYAAAMGAPTTSPCTDRLDHFAGLSDAVPQACTTVCPNPVAPGGAVLNFTNAEDNVGGMAAEALACLIPQGVVGCGYESPLEAMLQALSPDACWNLDGGCSGNEARFLREDAELAVVLLTDELDCSVANPAMMEDEGLFNVNPMTGNPSASSAICFNAGVACDPPSNDGAFGDCVAISDDNLHPTSRYSDFLAGLGKPVVLVPIVGVSNGGLAATTYRQWRGPGYPEGDIPVDLWNAGTDAADMNYALGLGPGCTAEGDVGGFLVQGLPPVRMAETCATVGSLGGGCCLSSICDSSYTSAFSCMSAALAFP